MTNTSTESGPAPRVGLLSRFIGIITAPGVTFRSVVDHPTWFGMLALSCAISALLVGGFLFTTVGQDAWLDAAVAGSWGDVNEQQYAAMERMKGFAGYLGIAQILIGVPFILLIVSGILFVIFNVIMGGNATFKQVLAVVVHTSPIAVLGQMITMPLNYVKGTLTSATNLAVLLPMVAETSFLGRFMGMIDLFLLWQLIVLAIGVAVLYKRRTGRIVATLFGIYAVVAILVAIIRISFGGSN
jgi:Yip1 domain